MADRVYLDHAATTPVLPAARAAMAEGLARWANPSSPHAEGRAAKAALEDARTRIKAALGWRHELIFTSGASEAAAIALKERGRYETLASAVEHDAVLRVEEGRVRLPVDRLGRIETSYGSPLSGALDPKEATEFFAIQHVNSETGVIQPIEALNTLRREAWVGRPTWLLCDCSQSAGKLPLPDADFTIVSAHKLGGPPGIGALLVRDLALLAPAGGQEQGYRGGTENLPAALGFAAALETRESRDHLAGLRAHLDAAVRAEGGEVVADGADRMAEIASYRLPGVSALAQLVELDAAGIAVSAGSACSSGTLRPSAVLTAMGWSATAAREVIRVSFAPETGDREVDRFLETWTRLARRRRAA